MVRGVLGSTDYQTRQEHQKTPDDAGGDNGILAPVFRCAAWVSCQTVGRRVKAMKTRFVLIETSHAGNVGACARALRVMGFDDMVLVAPRWANVLRREETIQRASGALDVLERTRIVATLDEALDGISHVCATAMTPRDFGPPTRHPREHLAALAAQTPTPTGVAFLFGSERFGMRNEDVYKAHVCLQIPTTPDFGSLNLGAAVQLLAYEWRLAMGGFAAIGPATGADPDTPADAASVAGMLKHWEEALVAVGFLDPQAPKKLMPRLQQLFNRAAPTPEEIHILRGIAKSMSQAAQAKNEHKR